MVAENNNVQIFVFLLPLLVNKGGYWVQTSKAYFIQATASRQTARRKWMEKRRV